MVEFDLITVNVPYTRDVMLYADMQVWAIDHCLSFVEYNFVHNELDRTDWYTKFQFLNEGEAAWFRLKWGV
jgi:hypothetical protein